MNQSDSTYEPKARCPNCGYMIDAGRCSECGSQVSEAVRRAYQIEAQAKRRRRLFWLALWKDASQLNLNVRLHMVDDLVARYDLKGMSRQEVEALLGKPDDVFSSWDTVYRLGPDRSSLSPGVEYLFLNIDDDGIVSEFAVGTD